MKYSLRLLQQSMVALLLTGWLAASPHRASAQVPVRPMTVVNDESGHPQRIAREIIVRFEPKDIWTYQIDDLGKQDGKLTDFVKAEAVEAISSKVGTWLGEVPTYKIFTRMTSADTLSIDRLGGTVPVEKLWASFVLLLPESLNEQTVCDSLNAAFPTVYYAHPNWVVQADKVEPSAYQPNDALSGEQANLFPTTQFLDGNINILRAWAVTTGKNHIKVGVYDTGINATHQDLNNGSSFGPIVTGGYDFLNNRPRLQIQDNHGHGTACAGIIAARRNNTNGISGIAGGNWASGGQDGVQLFDMKILSNDPDVTAPVSAVVNAIVEGSVHAAPSSGYGYALDVMNNSWGTPNLNSALKDAVRTAFKNKVVFVASRGNSGTTAFRYPACFLDSWVLNVGASGTDGNRKISSNGEPSNAADDYSSSYGNWMDIIAPGTSALVRTTESSGNAAMGTTYRSFRGTSAAVPHAVGTAALLLSAHNNPTNPSTNLAPEDVERLIERQAKDRSGSGGAVVGYDDYTGWGLLDAGAAVYKSRPGPYRVIHQQSSSMSYSLQQTNTSVVLAEPYSTAGLASGYYVADVYKATATFTPSSVLSSNETILDAWSRNSSSSLWSGANPIITEAGVQLDSWNQSAAVASGYIYHIKYTTSGASIDRWIPFSPGAAGQNMAVSYFTYDASQDYQLPLRPGASDSKLTAQAFPNPASQEIALQYALNEPCENVRLEVFNLSGQRVRNFTYAASSAGVQHQRIDLKGMATGVYTYRLITNSQVFTGKFLKQ